MEMQMDLEPEFDSFSTRGDHSDSGCAWVGHKTNILLNTGEDFLPPSNSCGSSDAPSARLILPVEFHCDEEECSLTASSKASIYCQKSRFSAGGVYVPTSPSYHLHCEAKDLGFQFSEHFKDLQSLRDKEDKFIILVDNSDNENLPPLPFQCKKCKKSFQELSDLQEHKKLHVRMESHWCLICGKKFLRAANLRMHKLIHSASRPHKCPECDKGFIRSADVWRHLCRMHKIERSSVVFGSANVKKPQSLQQNQEDHWNSRQLDSAVGDPGEEASKQYLCPICNKGFHKPNLLSKHRLIHQKEKLHRCKECDKAFIHLSRLKRHYQTHTGERPFDCKECGRTFTRIFTLQRHQRIHTGEKPYVCACCNQSFSELGTLKRHEQIHKVVQS